MSDTKFQQFETSVNQDGSVNILKVPIFKLGKHKGIDFTAELANEIIENHKKLKEENGYLSSVIIGHNESGKNEKTSEGFIDNLLVENDTIYSDLTKIDSDNFESNIKKKKYPHRSVEYNPKTKVFNALALLGGTAPHHKLPVMEFEDTEDRIKVDFEDMPDGTSDLKTAIEQDEKLDKIRKIWWKLQDFIDKIMFDPKKNDMDKKTEVKTLLNEGVQLLDMEAKNFEEETPMQILTEEQKQAVFAEHAESFREKYGMTPEEAAEKVQQMNQKLKDDAEKQFNDGITAFAEKLKNPKELAIAPALVDEFILPFMQTLKRDADNITFKEDDKDIEVSQVEFFERMIEKTIELASANTLQVPFDEMTEGIEYEGVQYGDWEKAIHNKAVKLAEKSVEDGKFKSFDEAYQAAVFQLAEKK